MIPHKKEGDIMVWRQNKFSSGWGKVLKTGDRSTNRYQRSLKIKSIHTRPIEKVIEMKHIPRNCIVCGNPFVPTHGKQKICSKACKQEYLRRYQNERNKAIRALQPPKQPKPSPTPKPKVIHLGTKDVIPRWAKYMQGGKYAIWVWMTPYGQFRITVDIFHHPHGYEYNFIMPEKPLESGILPLSKPLDEHILALKVRSRYHLIKLMKQKEQQ